LNAAEPSLIEFRPNLVHDHFEFRDLLRCAQCSKLLPDQRCHARTGQIDGTECLKDLLNRRNGSKDPRRLRLSHMTRGYSVWRYSFTVAGLRELPAASINHKKNKLKLRYAILGRRFNRALAREHDFRSAPQSTVFGTVRSFL